MNECNNGMDNNCLKPNNAYYMGNVSPLKAGGMIL